MTQEYHPLQVPAPHPASLADELLLAQCDLARGKSSGPGGQHRNKVETKVTLLHIPTQLTASAGERRSQEQNRKIALFRLRLTLATMVRCPVPIGEVRTQLWASRISPTGRIACNPEHADFPALLALAMDVLQSTRWNVGKAALRLGCTTSQLLKFVQEHPPAFAALNAARQEVGQRRLS